VSSLQSGQSIFFFKFVASTTVINQRCRKSKPALKADADQVLEAWERRLQGNGQVTPMAILQAAQVAACFLDPVYATVDKDCASLPEILAEH
jgi:hypothetical protein